MSTTRKKREGVNKNNKIFYERKRKSASFSSHSDGDDDNEHYLNIGDRLVVYLIFFSLGFLCVTNED
jgi:hypothetical protein